MVRFIILLAICACGKFIGSACRDGRWVVGRDRDSIWDGLDGESHVKIKYVSILALVSKQ